MLVSLRIKFSIIIVTPALTDMETLLRCIYARWKYPHIYTLSINTDQNQSTKVLVYIHSNIKSTTYKVITERDIIL